MPSSYRKVRVWAVLLALAVAALALEAQTHGGPGKQQSKGPPSQSKDYPQ